MYIPRHILGQFGAQLRFAGGRAPFLLALTALLVSCEGPSETGIAGPSLAVGTATRLVFTVEPNATTATAAIFPAVKVTALNASGNTATDFRGRVTIAIGTNPTGGVLQGTTAASADANGVATFSNLIISKAGTGYTLTASSHNLTPDTSVAFNVALPAKQLIFSVQPSTTSQGATISPAVQVTALDKNGGLAEGYRQNVTVAIGTNPGAGTLAGTTTVTFVHGVATFSDLSIDKVGSGYTLRATSLKLPAVTSAAFNITSQPSIVDLGTLGTPDGGATSEAHGINALGQIAGYSTLGDDAQFQAVLWTSGTSSAITQLGNLPGGSRSFAFAINAGGEVVGESETVTETGSHAFHATLWKSGTITDLGTLTADPNDRSRASGINDNGQIVGFTAVVGGGSHAFLWTPAQPGGTTGTMRDLGTLPSGGNASEAQGISADGLKVVGDATTAGNQSFHAFLWQSGTGMVDLGTLDGGTTSFAWAISPNGQKIVGSSTLASGETHAVLWENGSINDLHTLGGTYSIAYGVNDAGQIVGQASTENDAEFHAVLWENGAITDLGTLGGNANAFAINGNGQAVGQSNLTGNQVGHATLWP